MDKLIIKLIPHRIFFKLFKAIEHGDEEHRRWLLEAIIAFSNNKPIPKL